MEWKVRQKATKGIKISRYWIDSPGGQVDYKPLPERRGYEAKKIKIKKDVKQLGIWKGGQVVIAKLSLS